MLATLSLNAMLFGLLHIDICVFLCTKTLLMQAHCAYRIQSVWRTTALQTFWKASLAWALDKTQKNTVKTNTINLGCQVLQYHQVHCIGVQQAGALRLGLMFLVTKL